MPYPKPKFPNETWDGLTGNINRINLNSNVNPDAEDWERIAAEVISMQGSIGVLLPPITEDETLTVDVSSIILVDATAGNVTLILPTVASFTGKQLIVKKIDVSANTVTLDGAASETIDGDVTKIISMQYVSITIISNGQEWFIL